MATTPDYTGVEDSIKKGYDAQRQKAAQAEAGNLQGQRDALARRQAQLGGGPRRSLRQGRAAGRERVGAAQSGGERLDQ